MASGAPDQLDVVVLTLDPHAFLTRGGPQVGRDFFPQQVREELVHPSVGEQRGRGWWGINPDEGVTAWPRSAKNVVNARRRPLASMTRRAYRRAVDAEVGPVGQERCERGRLAAAGRIR